MPPRRLNGILIGMVLLGAANLAAAKHDYNAELHAAAGYGHLPTIINLLSKKHIDVNYRGPDGNPVLVVAAASKNPVVIRALLDAHADVNLRGTDGTTALGAALSNKDPVIARALIAAGADVNAPTKGGALPLMQASELGFADVVHDLLAANADPNVCNSARSSALLVSILSAKPLVARELLARQAYRRRVDDRHHQVGVIHHDPEE